MGIVQLVRIFEKVTLTPNGSLVWRAEGLRAAIRVLKPKDGTPLEVGLSQSLGRQDNGWYF